MTAVDTDLRSAVRAWLADNWDPQLTVREWWRRLAESGWAYPTWPVEWYGKAMTSDEAAIVRAEIKAAGALPPPHGIGQTMGAPVIMQFGTEEQKHRWLPKIATGEEAWCQFFSEPDAGSDLASLNTRAVRDGDEWVVNGQKVWNSGTLTADRAVMPVRTDPELPKHKGISFFIIDVDQPGIEVRPIKQMNGEAHFNETFFTDARVRHEDMIGEVNNGWMVTLATLANERTAYAAGADYGGHQASPGEKGGDLDLTCAEVQRRFREESKSQASFPLGDARALAELAAEFGRRDDPVLRDRLMKLHCLAEATRLTTMRAKAAADAGKAPGPESSLGYISGVHLARATRDLGLEIVGAYGTLDDDDAPHRGAVTMMALSSLVHGIQGGSEQIQRNIVGERVLGLPKEPQVDRDLPFSVSRLGRGA
jgi:alkylation response protein AidB-like acyl-CoA dehydrogenase